MDNRVKRVVKTIPAMAEIKQENSIITKKKVCAYCRVSTDSEEQLTSYTLQVQHYTKFIGENPNWEFVGIYADEGISGTKVKNRKEFQRMMGDARLGKIDIIYCKSISRFARNTVDCLTYIRELRDLGIDVVFETGNIHTLGANSEIVLTMLASMAEDGSRSISENVRWAKQKRYENGEVSWGYKYFLGYKKGDNGTIEIVPDEAVIVRRIYTEYLDGDSVNQIAKGLENDGIKTTKGSDKWQRSTILSILKNEKYKGDAILQKTYQRDFLSRKRVKNEGQAPQYFVENSHPPIVSRELYDLVQAEMTKRAEMKELEKTRYSSDYTFSGKLICSECGSIMCRGNRISNGSKYHIWQCPTHRQDRSACPTKAVNEEDIEDAFIKVVTELMGHRTELEEMTKIQTCESGDCSGGSIKNTDENNAKIGIKYDWDKLINTYEIDHLESQKQALESLQTDMYNLNQSYRKGLIKGEDYHDKSLKLMYQIDELIKDINRVENLKKEQILWQYRATETNKVLDKLTNKNSEIINANNGINSNNVADSKQANSNNNIGTTTKKDSTTQPPTFDTQLFKTLVDHIKIDEHKSMSFELKCGVEIMINN